MHHALGTARPATLAPSALRLGFAEGSPRAATFQLACISLGVGIFVMPRVFARTGLALGNALVIGWALAADLAMQSLLALADLTGAETYEGVLGAVFGRAGRVVTLVSLAIACFTANCAHFQFVATMFDALNGGAGFVATIAGADNPKARHALTMALFGLVALPLCFRRRLGELRHVSLGVVGFCLFTSTVVVAKMLAEIGHVCLNCSSRRPRTETASVWTWGSFC